MEIKLKKNNSGKVIVGIVLIFVGLLLLEDTFGFDFSGQIIPLALIGLGIAHMIRRRNKDLKSPTDKFHQKVNDFQTKVDEFQTKVHKKFNETNSSLDQKINQFERSIDNLDEKLSNFDSGFNDGFKNDKNSDKTHTGASQKNGKLKYEKAFGDLFVNFKAVNVENIEVSSAIGDIELQMREAVFTDGLNRLIISSFIGDIKIYLPKDLAIFVNCSSFIGDTEALNKRTNGFGNKVEVHSTDYDSATKKLYIACSCFIGDIHIYSV